MTKTSFINFFLLIKLACWTVSLFILYISFVAWSGESYLECMVYLILLGILIVSSSLYRINKRTANIEGMLLALLSALPIFGKSLDLTSSQVVETNRFMLHKLLTDEEKARMIDLTSELYGDENSVLLEKFLLTGPLDALENEKRNRKEEAEETVQ